MAKKKKEKLKEKFKKYLKNTDKVSVYLREHSRENRGVCDKSQSS
jgi:hypothetical protein